MWGFFLGPVYGISEPSSRLSSSSDSSTAEQAQTTNELPRSAYYIIMVEGCERFCSAGLRVILLIYFIHYFHTNHNTATAYYHLFLAGCHITPILGAIISDGYLGRYFTILTLSLVYFIGGVVLALSAIPSIGHQHLYVHYTINQFMKKFFFL